MYIACYDNRRVLPLDVLFFLSYTAERLALNLLTPHRRLRLTPRTSSLRHDNELRVVHLQNVPFFDVSRQLFDSIFVNYSTNPAPFERACFHRWLALNSVTAHLDPHDHVCLLDTDLLIGLHPSQILDLCKTESSSEIDFIADWDPADASSVCPALTIIRKRALHHFCSYLISYYFDSSNRSALLSGYYDRIGNGLSGGICDMRALASWLQASSISSFNLRTASTFSFISNFNSFIQSYASARLPWRITLNSHRQELFSSDISTQLVGIHFQGDAKSYLQWLLHSNQDLQVLSNSEIHSQRILKTSLRSKILRRFSA